jgi:chromate reductase
VALLGVASGRAGNLRGMDHLTGILNYLGAIVMPDKLPISRIGELLDAEGQLNDELTLATMRLHAEEFVHF